MIKENQRSLKRMAPSEKCDLAKRKKSGRGSGKHVAPGDNCKHGHKRRIWAWRYVSPTKRSGSGSAWREVTYARRFLLQQHWVADFMCVFYKASMTPQRSACWCSLSCGSERIP